MKQLIQHIPPILRNKYLLTLIGFLVWMTFFDRNDFITQYNRYEKLKELKESSTYLNNQIESARKELEYRKKDPKAYEKLAREKFYMKKDNEDLFVFEK